VRYPIGIGVLLLCVAPVIVNFLVKFDFLPYVFGEGKDWLGFFGGYFGGAIGAIVAVYVVRLQVENAKKEFQSRAVTEHKIRQEENRIYTTFSWEFAEWNLKDIESESAQIIYTYEYKIREMFLNTQKSNATTFAKVKFLGNSKFVTNCIITLDYHPYKEELKISRRDENTEQLPKVIDGKMKFEIPFLRADETMYIPITNAYLKEISEAKGELIVHRSYDVSKVTIEYTTPLLERIRFISNIDQQEENYYLLVNDNEELIMKSKMQNLVWKHPKRKIYDGKEGGSK
jgi:hypothetical protein